MLQDAQDVVRRLVYQRLDINLVLVGQREVDHHLDRVLASRLRKLLDRRIIPVDAVQDVQIGIVRLAGIGRCRPAALEDVVARLHTLFGGHQLAAYLRIGQAPLLLVERQVADLAPCRQYVERQIGFQREDRVDRACRALAEHAAAGRHGLVDVARLISPARRIVSLLGGQHAEHDRTLVGQRHLTQPREERTMRRAARDVGPDLEDSGVEFGHRRHDAVDLLPFGDTAGDGRVVRRHMGRGARTREAHGPCTQRFLHEIGHANHLVLGRLLGEGPPAHRIHAQRRVADIHAVVDRLGQALHGREIFREGFPRPVDAGRHRFGRDVLDCREAARIEIAVLGLAGRQGEAAIAHHHRGDAVPARAASQRIPRDLRVHVGVAVDEARRDDQPVGIDRARTRRGDPADLGNHAVLDADIGRETLAARAVDDGAATDDDIVCHHRRSLFSTIFQ